MRGFNTVLTGGIFLVLSSMSAPAFANTVAFATGIAFALVVTPRFVFRARVSNAQRIRYVGWYLTVYVFGLGTICVLHDKLMLGNTIGRDRDVRGNGWSELPRRTIPV